MIRRFVLAAVAVGWLLPSPPFGAEKALSAQRFDVDLVLARDGSVAVTETIAFRLDGGPFTSIVRQLSTRSTDGIVDLAASIDGTPCPVGRQPGQVQIKRKDGVTVTWRFLPASDTVRTLTLSYRARGVVRQSAASDLFTWRAIPGGRSYPVEAGTVQVSWPQGGVLLGAPRISYGTAEVANDGKSATFAASEGLGRDARLEVTLEFVAGSAAAAMPNWQSRQERGRAAAPALAMSAGAILLAAAAWMLTFWFGRRPEPIAAAPVTRVAAPPDALPAAVASALMSPGASVTWAQALATLVELAERGIVRIEEPSDRPRFGVREYLLHLDARPTELRGHERGLLDMVFTSKAGPVTTVKLSAAGGAAQSRLKLFKLPLTEELAAAGLVSPEEAQTRSALVRWGLLLVVLAAAGFVVGGVLVSEYNGWPMLVPASLMLVAVSVLIMASQFSVLSSAGRARAVDWRSFFRFIKEVAQGREPITDPSWLERYLPYAVARGSGQQWVRRFDKAGAAAQVPEWFVAVPASSDRRTPLARLADMLSRGRAAGMQHHAGA